MASILVLAVAIIYSICAVPSSDAAPKAKNVGIVGGHKIRIEDVPYMASLRIDGMFHFCGASIIHERFILTAAHCILPYRRYNVKVGSSRSDGGGEIYEVEKIIPHENYNNKTDDNDICLIKLASSLQFSDKVNRIVLNDGHVPMNRFTMLNVTGWGNTAANGQSSNELLQVQVPVVSTSTCRFIYFRILRDITKRMFCAGIPGKDSCQGDSGGPLALNNVQVGITSFGIGCGTAPGVYTKVSEFIPWVAENMARNL